MAPVSTKDRLNEIQTRLDETDGRLKKIETAIGLKSKDSQSVVTEFRAHVWQWIVANRSWLIPVVAILVGIMGWFGSAEFKFWLDHKDDAFNTAVDNRLDKSLKSPGGVLTTLGEVQKTANETSASLKTLQPFIHDVIDHQFESVSKLSPETLGQRLPALSDLIAVARDQNVDIEEGVAKALRRSLMNVRSSSPGFWAAAGEFISYRSLRSAALPEDHIPPDIAKRAGPRVPNLGNCYERPMSYNDNGIPRAPIPIDIYLFDALILHDCTLYLDDVAGFYHSTQAKHISDEAKSTSGKLTARISLTLVRVVVVYRGGPAIPISQLAAYDCQFEFSLPSTPPQEGRELVQALLAQDVESGNLKLYLPPT